MRVTMRKALILLLLLTIPAVAQVPVGPWVNPHVQFLDSQGIRCRAARFIPTLAVRSPRNPLTRTRLEQRRMRIQWCLTLAGTGTSGWGRTRTSS
jgi:hypothetical protein